MAPNLNMAVKDEDIFPLMLLFSDPILIRFCLMLWFQMLRAGFSEHPHAGR